MYVGFFFILILVTLLSNSARNLFPLRKRLITYIRFLIKFDEFLTLLQEAKSVLCAQTEAWMD